MLPFSGALAAAITPSRSDTYQLDLAAALEVVDFLCSHHVKGIALFGATGEFPHFPVEERIRLTHMAVKRSRVPVLVNATHSCFAEARRIAGHAAEDGAAAVMLQPPYYYRYDAPEILQFYADMISELDGEIPILLYNLPLFNNALPIEVACELLSCGAAAGIKDSSGDWEYMWRLLGLRGQYEFPLLVGNDSIMVRARQSGADGFISGCAGAVPELLVALDDAIVEGAEHRVSELSPMLDEFLQQILTLPLPLGIRECLSARGLKVGAMPVPLSPGAIERAQALREWFKNWLPVMRAAVAQA
jgi:dihydrodipicolinate synthase/N-acetylneuraminate lyase